MGLGAIPPTEIVFAARLQADANTEKLNKNDAIPQDNFLKPEWQHKPFRNYTIFYDADVHKVRFTRTPDGIRHASIEFVAVVYTGDGEEVNSIIQTATLDMTAGSLPRTARLRVAYKSGNCHSGEGQLLLAPWRARQSRRPGGRAGDSRRSNPAGRSRRERANAVSRMG